MEARAGSGKSFTIEAALNKCNALQSLYLVFNKQNKQDFECRGIPRHVQVKTFDSICYSEIVLKQGYKPKFDLCALTAMKICQELALNEFTKLSGTDLNTFASLIRKTLRRFCLSTSSNVCEEMVPARDIEVLSQTLADRANQSSKITGIKNAESDSSKLRHELTQAVIDTTQFLWGRIINPKDSIHISFQEITKLAQLQGLQFGYRRLYIDEAQDINLVQLATITGQKYSQFVFVGDPAQAIYSWRGANETFSHIPYRVLQLTECWRFNESIALIANQILFASLREGNLKGRGHSGQLLISPPDFHTKHTYIARTNLGVVEYAIQQVAAGRVVKASFDTKLICALLWDVYGMFSGTRKQPHEKLEHFLSWEELEKAVNTEELDDPEAIRAFHFVRKHKHQTPDKIRAIQKVDMLDSTVEPDVFVTTCHKSKGAEWPNVVIGDDFCLPEIHSQKMILNQREHFNLLYVAVTRVTDKLYVSERLKAWLLQVSDQSKTLQKQSLLNRAS